MWIHHYAPLRLFGCLLPADDSPAQEIHRRVSRAVWQQRQWRMGLDLVGTLLLWPVYAVVSSAWMTWQIGPTVKRRSDKSCWRQFGEQLVLALTSSLLPRWYYMFELYYDRRRRQAPHYLHRFETKKGIYQTFKDTARATPSLSPLSDKAAFALRCYTYALPAVPVILTVTREHAVSPHTQEVTLPPLDLFIKPSHGKGGRGAQRWDYQPPGFYRRTDGTLYTASQLLRYLCTLTHVEGWIIQPRVVNHPALADLSTGALATVRLVTCRNECGEFEVTHAAFRMARGTNTVVDNFHAGGIAAKVDLQDGRLSSASDQGLRSSSRWVAHHPDTRGRILGRQLPFWQETLSLARQAHAAFADRLSIGWGVAILANGPCLIKGNSSPDLDIIQRTHQQPVGNSRLGELLAFYLRCPHAHSRGSSRPLLRRTGAGVNLQC